MRATETHISICGHAQHGKSTVAGRLLYELRTVDDRELDKLREEAEERNRKYGKRVFNEFSVMFLKQRSDTYTSEQQRDNPSRTEFPQRGSVTLGGDRLISLIDTPGWSRFLNNIIYGIYLSDMAVLVVEATAGVERGTEDVVRICMSLGVPVIAIFVTKMDVVGYSQLRFDEVSEQIDERIFPMLRQHTGTKPPVVPVSALAGAGFKAMNPEMSWAIDIPTALQVLEEAQRVASPATVEGVRFAVEGSREVFSPPGVGTVLVGVLETGTLRVGSELLLEPASRIQSRPVTLRTRFIHRARTVTQASGEAVREISAREIVAVATPNLTRNQASEHLRHGGVLGTPTAPPSVATEAVAEVIFFEKDTVYSGKSYNVHTNASTTDARILRITEAETLYHDLNVEKFTADVGQMARATIRFDRPVCIESSPDYQRLTRFILRESDRIVACGRCTKILQ